MRRPPNLPLVLLVAGAALFAVAVVLALVVEPGGPQTAVPPTTTAPSVPATTAAAPSTTTATAPSPTATAPPTPSEAPAPIAFSWQSAGGLVVHADAIDPVVLGEAMRAAGFGWVAVELADGPNQVALPEGWIARFRAASGLPVGGWSVLRDDPVGEANLAAGLVAQDGLDFYIADAELEYAFTNSGETSTARRARSREFVAAFRAAEPTLPAGLSSYCRPDMNDLDWRAWAQAGFEFLPQAYVDQFGDAADPAVCVEAAARWFPANDVHPTIGVFPSSYPTPAPQQYGSLLTGAQTRGFSVYPAENVDGRWSAFGEVVRGGVVAAPAAS